MILSSVTWLISSRAEIQTMPNSKCCALSHFATFQKHVFMILSDGALALCGTYEFWSQTDNGFDSQFTYWIGDFGQVP